MSTQPCRQQIKTNIYYDMYELIMLSMLVTMKFKNQTILIFDQYRKEAGIGRLCY